MTFDYYALRQATAKTDLRSMRIFPGEKNSEGLFRLEWRKELDHSYARYVQVLAPFYQHVENFVEDYDPGHQRSPWEMPWQGWMIGTDYTDSLKSHP